MVKSALDFVLQTYYDYILQLPKHKTRIKAESSQLVNLKPQPENPGQTYNSAAETQIGFQRVIPVRI